MRGPVCTGDQRAELAADKIVDGFAVDGLARQLGHDGLHHAAHVFLRCGARGGDGRIHGALELRAVHGGGQVRLQHRDLGGFLVGQIFPAAFGELFDRIPPLLHQRGHDLPRLVVVQRAAALHFAVHQRRFQHPQRDEPRRDLSPSSSRRLRG